MFALILTGLLTSPSIGADVELAWDPNTEPDLAGYKVYYGSFSRNYEHIIDVGNNIGCIISGLNEGESYYFSATAYDTENNESDYSNEVYHTVPEDDPIDPPQDPIDPPDEPENPYEDDPVIDEPTVDIGSGSGSGCFIGTLRNYGGRAGIKIPF